MADIVDDVLNRMTSLLQQGIPLEQARQQSEAAARQQWGGTEPYVRRGTKSRANAEQRALQIGEALRQGKGRVEAFAAAGASRSAGFRLMGRRSFVKGGDR